MAFIPVAHGCVTLAGSVMLAGLENLVGLEKLAGWRSWLLMAAAGPTPCLLLQLASTPSYPYTYSSLLRVIVSNSTIGSVLEFSSVSLSDY